jgi:hypothetical protein
MQEDSEKTITLSECSKKHMGDISAQRVDGTPPSIKHGNSDEKSDKPRRPKSGKGL